MIFINLEKIYDKILRNIIWWVLEKKKVPTKCVTRIKNIYTNIVISIKAYNDESNIFFIKIELHKESALSSYTLVMDEDINDI
jgi:hypothetical protein